MGLLARCFHHFNFHNLAEANMKEINGNIWSLTLNDRTCRVCIPICRTYKKNGDLVMGKGLAKEAAKLSPVLPRMWGINYTNLRRSFLLKYYDTFIGFPTKRHWRDQSDLDLITASAMELLLSWEYNTTTQILIPQVGCGEGGLAWGEVRPILRRILAPDHFVAVIYQ